MTVYSAKVDVPMKWRIGSPSRERRVVPSGRKPSPQGASRSVAIVSTTRGPPDPGSFGVAVSATVGDLGESLIKRDLGIKDMGDLLPGHGGLMDRMDSLLPSAAVAYLLLAALVPA